MPQEPDLPFRLFKNLLEADAIPYLLTGAAVIYLGENNNLKFVDIVLTDSVGKIRTLLTFDPGKPPTDFTTAWKGKLLSEAIEDGMACKDRPGTAKVVIIHLDEYYAGIFPPE